MVAKKNIKEGGLLKIERKYAWSFLGFILAIIFGAFSIYTTFFIDKSPELEYKILSDVRVLDIYANVQDLEILYKKENILEQGKNLSIITLKIENVSNLDINSSLYDPNNPLGLKISNATVVELPEIIDASNAYLKENIKISQVDSIGEFTFSNVIIDKHQSFNVKLLLLHKSDQIPLIHPIGKIAGIERIIVRNEISEIKISFWRRLIQGSIGIHVSRFFFYLLAILAFVMVFILPPSLLADSIATKKRKKLVLKYKTGKKIASSISTDFIFDSYINRSDDYLIEIQQHLRDKNKLKGDLEDLIKEQEKRSSQSKELAIPMHNLGPDFSPVNRIVHTLYYEDLIKLENGQLLVDSNFETELNEFVSFLKLIA